MNASCLVLLGQALDEVVEEVDAVIEIFDANAFVFPVGAVVVDVHKDPRYTIRRNVADAKILAVGGAGVHHRNYWQVAVEFGANLFDLAHDLRIEWRSGRGNGIAYD